jgi:hypothetical protein
MSFGQRVLRNLLGTALLLVGSRGAFGEEAFDRFIWVTVKPGQSLPFEKFCRSVIDAAVESSSPGTIVGFSVDVGSDANTYVFVQPFERWADLDSFATIQQILESAYGREEGSKILASGTATIESAEVWFIRTLGDLNRHLPSRRVRLVHLMRTEVDPAMTSAYESYLAKVKAAEDKTPQSRGVLRSVSVSGPAAVYQTAFLFDSWAAREESLATEAALANAYGESLSRELSELSERCVRKRSSYLLSARPDLSVKVQATSDRSPE